MSKQFDARIVTQLTNREEIERETHSSAGGAQRTMVWVVVEDQDVYVRSVRGQQGRWYQQFLANPQGAIQMEGQQLSVRAIPLTDDETISRVSEASLRTYRHCPSIGSIVRPETLPTTLRLEPG